jgi:hypothetical protein
VVEVNKLCRAVGLSYLQLTRKLRQLCVRLLLRGLWVRGSRARVQGLGLRALRLLVEGRCDRDARVAAWSDIQVQSVLCYGSTRPLCACASDT